MGRSGGKRDSDMKGMGRDKERKKAIKGMKNGKERTCVTGVRGQNPLGQNPLGQNPLGQNPLHT